MDLGMEALPFIMNAMIYAKIKALVDVKGVFNLKIQQMRLVWTMINAAMMRTREETHNLVDGKLRNIHAHVVMNLFKIVNTPMIMDVSGGIGDAGALLVNI